MRKEYIQTLVNAFNNKTGLNIDYVDLCKNLSLIEDANINNQKDREEVANLYSSLYNINYIKMLENLRLDPLEKASEKAENFLQEYDAMMTEIYESEFSDNLKFEENDIAFDFGYIEKKIEKGSGKINREVQFKRHINLATDLEREMRESGDYTEKDIVDSLNHSIKVFDPKAYRAQNDDKVVIGANIGALASRLEIARNHYNQKSFFKRLFSFKERKAINQAKKKITLALHNPRLGKAGSKEIEHYCRAAIPSSDRFKIMENSFDYVDLTKVTNYKEITQKFNNKDKAIEQQEKTVQKQNEKQIKAQMYKEFTEKYKELAGKTEQERELRHQEFNKYYLDPIKYDKEHEISKIKISKDEIDGVNKNINTKVKENAIEKSLDKVVDKNLSDNH